MKVADKSLQKHSRSLIPERVLRLTAFGRCVLKEVCGKTLNVIITLQIYKRVIAMALFHIDQVNHLNVIAVFFEKISRITKQFSFRVKHNEACIGIHNVRFGKKSCLTGTTTAAHKHIEIPSVFSAVKTDGDILREQFVFRISFIGIFLVDCAGRAPFRRAVFFAPSVILLCGQVNTDGNTIYQKQNEDSFYTVLTERYLKWVFHNDTEVLHQTHETVFHTGRYQKAEPRNRNNTAKIKDNILP